MKTEEILKKIVDAQIVEINFENDESLSILFEKQEINGITKRYHMRVECMWRIIKGAQNNLIASMKSCFYDLDEGRTVDLLSKCKSCYEEKLCVKDVKISCFKDVFIELTNEIKIEIYADSQEMFLWDVQEVFI